MRFAQHHLHFHHLGGISWLFQKLSLITIGILISILLISPLIDQQISNYFMNQDSIFGTLFQNYGLFPPTLILIISTVILNYYIFTTFQNKLAKILTLLISFIFTLIKPMNSCQKPLNICYLHQKTSKIINQWVWQIMKETLEMLYL